MEVYSLSYAAIVKLNYFVNYESSVVNKQIYNLEYLILIEQRKLILEKRMTETTFIINEHKNVDRIFVIGRKKTYFIISLDSRQTNARIKIGQQVVKRDTFLDPNCP